MIRIQNLSKKFGKSRVLDGLNLEISRGDRIALVGQNGAGKTTLIRIILGHYLHEGDVEVFELNPRKHRVAVLDRVGFVPQLPPPIQMSVEELVSFSAKTSSKSSEVKIHQHASNLGLDITDNARKNFQKLSGGMKQKLLIALALAREPEILIMDEPAANLDPKGRQAFFLYLTRYMKDTTMLLSSHRVDEVLNLITRIVELDFGQIVRNERIDQLELAGQMLNCRVRFISPNDAAGKVLRNWNFNSINGGLEFEGHFVGADRLRFLTELSHFGNYIQQLNIDQRPDVS